MNKRVLTGFLLVSTGFLLLANGQQDTQYGQGLRDGSGRGASMAAGRGYGRNSAGQNGGSYGLENRFSEDMNSILADADGGELSQAEAEGLIFMRQEEQLARDVYRELFSVWNLPIFRNIATSEQQHMDSIKILLDTYGLDDPAADKVPGTYADPELTRLYEELVAEGRESIVAALTVGAVIEDLDIRDLQEQIALSDNDDIRILYQNLMKGSRNHIRSFLRQLDREGLKYEARYISGEYLKKVLSINQETAPITDPGYDL